MQAISFTTLTACTSMWREWWRGRWWHTAARLGLQSIQIILLCINARFQIFSLELMGIKKGKLDGYLLKTLHRKINIFPDLSVTEARPPFTFLPRQSDSQLVYPTLGSRPPRGRCSLWDLGIELISLREKINDKPILLPPCRVVKLGRRLVLSWPTKCLDKIYLFSFTNSRSFCPPICWAYFWGFKRMQGLSLNFKSIYCSESMAIGKVGV